MMMTTVVIKTLDGAADGDGDGDDDDGVDSDYDGDYDGDSDEVKTFSLFIFIVFALASIA